MRMRRFQIATSLPAFAKLELFTNKFLARIVALNGIIIQYFENNEEA